MSRQSNKLFVCLILKTISPDHYRLFQLDVREVAFRYGTGSGSDRVNCARSLPLPVPYRVARPSTHSRIMAIALKITTDG